ncbi:MAG TPA: hypothetical protein QF564_08075 [Pirellulaceae bacterium]|nr:hypothetical protein [Pirellulaceae bacterium]
MSSRHFRNQVRYLHQHYDAFRELFQQTWSGVRVSSFDSPNSSYEDELALMLSEDGFVAEASNFGHGLQMWLQIVWFLARTASDCVVVLDEPDVYMHVEQQSNMIDMLRGRFRQCILSTHAIKIIEGCDDSEVLRLHRKLPTSLHGVDQRTYDRRVNEVMAESCRDSLGNREEAPNVTTKPHTAPVVKSVNLTARRFDKAFVHIRDEAGNTVVRLEADGDESSEMVAIQKQRLDVQLTFPEDVDIYIGKDAVDLSSYFGRQTARVEVDLNDY